MAFLVAKHRLPALPIVAKPNVVSSDSISDCSKLVLKVNFCMIANLNKESGEKFCRFFYLWILVVRVERSVIIY